MPYITRNEQAKLERYSYTGANPHTPDNAGELTYIFTKESCDYVKKHGKSFLTCCIIIGALICTALEFYRRVVAPYEEMKIKTNGDVY